MVHPAILELPLKCKFSQNIFFFFNSLLSHGWFLEGNEFGSLCRKLKRHVSISGNAFSLSMVLSSSCVLLIWQTPSERLYQMRWKARSDRSQWLSSLGPYWRCLVVNWDVYRQWVNSAFKSLELKKKFGFRENSTYNYMGSKTF